LAFATWAKPSAWIAGPGLITLAAFACGKEANAKAIASAEAAARVFFMRMSVRPFPTVSSQS
jgi:hypothetical protein